MAVAMRWRMAALRPVDEEKSAKAKRVRNRVDSSPRLPDHFLSHLLTIFRTDIYLVLIRLIATLITLPVINMEVFHYRDHCDVITHLFKTIEHFYIKIFINRTMSVHFCDVFSPAQSNANICGSTLADRLRKVYDVDSRMLRNGRICPSSIQDSNNFSFITDTSIGILKDERQNYFFIQFI